MSEEAKCKENEIQENATACRRVNIQSNGDENNINYFTFLPLEIQYRIFESCNLSELLIAAKVCKTFREIIRDFCQRKYEFFEYNYQDLRFSKLKDDEISDLCCLCGEAIEKAYIDCHLWMFQELINFKKNVKYFKNLMKLEVDARALEDNIILELVIEHCSKLKTLKILNFNDRWMWDEHLAKLKSIENLELVSEYHIDFKPLLNISRKIPLKYLSIQSVDCCLNTLQMLVLCNYWLNLETLKLPVFTRDNDIFNAIFNLPNLKLLEFYFRDFYDFMNFEVNFFSRLQNHRAKCLALQCIKFRSKYMECELADLRWQWPNKVFDNILKCFRGFKNLQTLCFQDCRPLSYDQLKKLGLCLKQLKMITICSHPKADDKIFHQEWLEMGNECQLNFDGFLTSEEMMGSRSITCQFA